MGIDNEKLFFSSDYSKIYNDDFLTTNCIPNKSIDLIITSPPYNLDISYNSHDDKMPYSTYLEFTKKYLSKSYKLAKDDCRFCLNIPLDKNKGGQKSIYADIVTIAKKTKWEYHSTIVWNEQNISRRTAWGSWMSPSAPYVIAPVEMIVILYKKIWKKEGKGKEKDIERNEFMDWTNGVWTFQGESKKKIGHPAPFPLELPKRCIKLFSYVGDTILDPFLGSGTTLVACELLKRQGIGVEIDGKYCDIAKKRITKEANIGQLTIEDIIKEYTAEI